MALNIKNERVVALAREAAHRTGQTQTSALEQALTQYLAGLPDAQQHRAARVHDLVVEFNAGLTDDDRAAMRRAGEELYDETGLFR